MSFTTTHVPDVSALHPAFDGEGLLLSGYASPWNLDKQGDIMNPYALDASIATFMATNPVLLYAHKLGLPPVGKILKAEVHRAKGLFIEAILPRPKDGTLGAEIWEAVKQGVMRALSLWSIAQAAEYKALTGEAAGLSYLADRLANFEQRRAELDQLDTAVARIRLGMPS